MYIQFIWSNSQRRLTKNTATSKQFMGDNSECSKEHSSGPVNIESIEDIEARFEYISSFFVDSIDAKYFNHSSIHCFYENIRNSIGILEAEKPRLLFIFYENTKWPCDWWSCLLCSLELSWMISQWWLEEEIGLTSLLQCRGTLNVQGSTANTGWTRGTGWPRIMEYIETFLVTN